MDQGVRFGSYRFDSATGQLWCGTREVRLTPKGAAVLNVLMTHAAQPVSKEELFAAVWSGTAVSDDVLTSCIQELRRALEDDPQATEGIHRAERLLVLNPLDGRALSLGSLGLFEDGQTARAWSGLNDRSSSIPMT
jgi:DNA-binding SARP family transcriptional activator